MTGDNEFLMNALALSTLPHLYAPPRCSVDFYASWIRGGEGPTYWTEAMHDPASEVPRISVTGISVNKLTDRIAKRQRPLENTLLTSALP
jgi:hypothetical protein